MPAGSYVKRMPWGQQKPLLGYGIDWSHPLAANVLSSWLFNEYSGALVCDLARRYDITFAIGAASPIWGNNGVLMQDDYFNQLYIAGSPYNFVTGQKFSVVFSCSITNWLDRYICSTRGAVNQGWGIYLSSITYKISFVHFGVAVYEGAAAPMTYNTFQGAVCCSSTNASIYRNGELELAPARGIVKSSDYFQVGASNNGNALKGGLYHLTIWKDRELSADNIAQLYAEPYSFIEGWNYGRSYSIPSGIVYYGSLIGDSALIGNGVLIGGLVS